MTRCWIALLVLPLTACDWLNTDDTEEPDDTGSDSGDTEDVPGCPIGWSESRNAGLTVTTFTVNGLALLAGFDGNATLDDRPTSCIADDGSGVDFLFVVDDQLYGSITLRDLDGEGAKDPNGDAEQLVISLTGAQTPVTYLNGDWQSASLYVSSAGGTIAFDFAGNGVRSGQTLNIQFSAEASQ